MQNSHGNFWVNVMRFSGPLSAQCSCLRECLTTPGTDRKSFTGAHIVGAKRLGIKVFYFASGMVMFEELTRPQLTPDRARRWRRSRAAGFKRPYLIKRGFDLAAVIVTAPFWMPVVGTLAVLARRDGGKAFYAQWRVGRDGKPFRLWKLRSMVPDAESRLEAYLAANPAARQEWDVHQKLKQDPRVTRLGHFLRTYSLDELPQLWNVLVGDMSLVGPRPMFLAQEALYPGTDYYDFRPGLTGLWQISERNGCTFAARAHYDNLYAERISLSTDISILFLTVGVVFKGTGC